LNVIKKLTDGVVAKNIDWSTIKAPRDVADILHTTRQGSKHSDSTTSSHGHYSLQESCDLLRSSYDDLYDDVADDADGSAPMKIDDDQGDKLSCMPNSKTATNDVKGDGAVLDSDIDDSSDDYSDCFTMEDRVDLYSPDVWDSYYTRLQEIGQAMKDREGWPNFDAVFMISAIDSDGVVDVKVNSLYFVSTIWM